MAGATGGRKPYKPAAKDALHILFVVSRPDEAGFLDPRADSEPVLDAIDEHAPGRVTHEFLRPPRLDALVERLEDTSKTASADRSPARTVARPWSGASLRYFVRSYGRQTVEHR